MKQCHLVDSTHIGRINCHHLYRERNMMQKNDEKNDCQRIQKKIDFNNGQNVESFSWSGKLIIFPFVAFAC